MNITHHKQLDVTEHDGIAHGLHLAGKLVTATADDLNGLSTSGVTIALSPGSTEEILATITLEGVTAPKVVEVIVSDQADGSTLTATAASGALTADTGSILQVLTAKKHVKCITDATGTLVLSLVDDAKSTDQRFCVITGSGTIVVGPASETTDYGA